MDISFKEYEYIGVSSGVETQRFMPPEIAEIIFYLGSSGVALALYKLMRLWVDTINGRKLRVKVGNIEIEATQLSEKKFLKLLEVTRDREKQRLEMIDKVLSPLRLLPSYTKFSKQVDDWAKAALDELSK